MKTPTPPNSRAVTPAAASVDDAGTELVRAIDAVLSGTATPADIRTVSVWKDASPANAALLLALPGVLAQQSGDANARFGALHAHMAWTQLQQRLELPNSNAAVATPAAASAASHDIGARANARVAQTTWRRWQWAAAAAIVIAVGSYWQFSRTAMQTLTAPLGQRVAVTLPDGSRLTLAAGSRASWPRRFAQGSRDVRVDGEAYFDVVHDERVPFRVHIRHAIAEDIGTRFVVRGWPELAGVDVAVEEGEVALADSAAARTTAVMQQRRLQAGDRGRLDGAGHVTVTRDAALALGWLEGELHFDGTPLREALPVIGRWYGVNITAPAALLDRRLSARFETQPLPQLLDMLTAVLGVEIEQRGTQITLIP
ncbi:MAG: FecR domain-containing protein [Gemmatimonadaceae bacterium]|nr:FecR domain-containing protein [Gemmatimonadaceae bacterium]